MRTVNLVRGTILVCAAALAVAGCSTGASSTSTPPPVTLDDLSVGSYLAAPCSLLDADQLSEYGVSRPGVASGSTCAWTPDDPGKPSFRAGAATGTGALTGTSMKINGYPAENQSTGATGCAVRVAVAATEQIIVALTGQDACHAADMVATSVLATIKRLSP